jgi:protein gp37
MNNLISEPTFKHGVIETAENRKIEWCDHTLSSWIGCQKVSPGYDYCYAEEMMDHRYGRVKWGPHGKRVRTSEAYWKQPFRWAKAARESGTRPRAMSVSLCPHC